MSGSDLRSMSGGHRLVLVGVEPAMTGHERLCAVFPAEEPAAEDVLLLPLETGRSANQVLLEAEKLYLRDADGASVWTVLGRRALSDRESNELDRQSLAPLGTSLDVLRLGRPGRSVPRPDRTNER